MPMVSTSRSARAGVPISNARSDSKVISIVCIGRTAYVKQLGVETRQVAHGLHRRFGGNLGNRAL